jgi:hypothetical protein
MSAWGRLRNSSKSYHMPKRMSALELKAPVQSPNPFRSVSSFYMMRIEAASSGGATALGHFETLAAPDSHGSSRTAGLRYSPLSVSVGSIVAARWAGI